MIVSIPVYKLVKDGKVIFLAHDTQELDEVPTQFLDLCRTLKQEGVGDLQEIQEILRAYNYVPLTEVKDLPSFQF